MLAGSPKFLSRFSSTNTITAANIACNSTGRTIAPWIAPLMNRNTSGHLQNNQWSIRNLWIIVEQSKGKDEPPWFLPCRTSKRKSRLARMVKAIRVVVVELRHSHSCEMNSNQQS